MWSEHLNVAKDQAPLSHMPIARVSTIVYPQRARLLVKVRKYTSTRKLCTMLIDIRYWLAAQRLPYLAAEPSPRTCLGPTSQSVIDMCSTIAHGINRYGQEFRLTNEPNLKPHTVRRQVGAEEQRQTILVRYTSHSLIP